jgi:hypothetical protein
MKVYCKNCKYFKYGNDFYSADYCKSPELGIVKDYIYGDKPKVISIYDKDYPNKTGDCKFYRPKKRWYEYIISRGVLRI